MKVTIGPYRNWFGPYQLASALCFWVPKVKDRHGFREQPAWVHKFGEWLAHGEVLPEPAVGEVYSRNKRPETWLYRLLKRIDHHRQRKVQVRIDPWDTWSMDHTLGLIALPMLKQLRDNAHGAPPVDMTDVPQHLRINDVESKAYWTTGETDEKFFERWNWVLDEMIHSFECVAGDLQDWEEQFSTGEYDLRLKKLENGSQMVEGPNHTIKTDNEAREAYAERIQNGFRLFGKYYQNLWS